MNVWIVLYHHRHGVDAWPVFQATVPDEDEIIEGLDEYEPDREEYVEIVGPFEAPKSTSSG